MKNFEFICSCCGEVHQGIPSFGTDAPVYFYHVPENEREERTFLTSDTCVIDDKDFFVKGCLEMPVLGYDETFSFNAWVSLSETKFFKFRDLLDGEEREHHEPMVGWFSTWIYPFEETERLIAKIHFRNDGIRPLIELQPTEHPLAIAQMNGIKREQIQVIYEYYVHGEGK
ncbi:MAG: DUF2199 domain-containing protein [Bacteroidota bacterium]|nr:DUF2199 domain-containing protein [Bacteroidota bacterium]